MNGTGIGPRPWAGGLGGDYSVNQYGWSRSRPRSRRFGGRGDGFPAGSCDFRTDPIARRPCYLTESPLVVRTSVAPSACPKSAGAPTVAPPRRASPLWKRGEAEAGSCPTPSGQIHASRGAFTIKQSNAGFARNPGLAPPAIGRQRGHTALGVPGPSINIRGPASGRLMRHGRIDDGHYSLILPPP